MLQRRASAAATAAAGDPVAEAGRFHAALERAKAELSALAEGEAVFAAHLEMAGDPMLAGLVEGRLAEKHLSAEQALGEACEEVCGMFAALDDTCADVPTMCGTYARVSAASCRAKPSTTPLPDWLPGRSWWPTSWRLRIRHRWISAGSPDW
ncbi:MAG: phosphoenolpyruvate-utilizing N-terminal domain-containing protein [Alistipes onderdonkii]